MNIQLKLTNESLTTITSLLLPIYNTKVVERRHKSMLSLCLDVVNKLDNKFRSIKVKTDLFSSKNRVTINLKFHEADALELLLLQEIKKVTNKDVARITQKVIDELNQKLA